MKRRNPEAGANVRGKEWGEEVAEKRRAGVREEKAGKGRTRGLRRFVKSEGGRVGRERRSGAGRSTDPHFHQAWAQACGATNG